MDQQARSLTGDFVTSGSNGSKEFETETSGLQEPFSWTIRGLATEIVEHEDFETVILLGILGNCISLALHDPLHDEHGGRNESLFWVSLSQHIHGFPSPRNMPC